MEAAASRPGPGRRGGARISEDGYQKSLAFLFAVLLPQVEGYTAVQLAVIWGKPDILVYLLSRGFLPSR